MCSVKMIAEKLDPEELGIVTLSSFLGEFYPTDFTQQSFTSHVIYHYNGLSRSHTNNKVTFCKCLIVRSLILKSYVIMKQPVIVVE